LTFHRDSFKLRAVYTLPYQMHKTRVAMDDGRVLNLYDFAPAGRQPVLLEAHRQAAHQNPPGAPRILPVTPEMRWNPTLSEWTVYGAPRMDRVQLPSREVCPLCPGGLELPLPYQIAIFENRSPALAYIPPEIKFDAPSSVIDMKAPARGRCDMVVYSQQHEARLATMELHEVVCLIEAWRDRYRELMAIAEVQYVAILENKGREAGMTLEHPHGQIYALPFLPPQVQRQWEATQNLAGAERGLWDRIIEKELKDGTRIICQTEGILAVQPYYARYPFEVHIFAKRRGVSSLLEMNGHERAELASVMQNIVRRYENLWPAAAYDFPTLMVMQQISRRGGAEDFRFHIEYMPLQRSPEKLKYRASLESGTGTFLNDALPETQAAQLRATAPHEVELPNIVFAD
jgi:UDPglucose--hexose-1-phosphate uridylyltransferase